jgi:type II secretory pathway pseudopilin PulG
VLTINHLIPATLSKQSGFSFIELLIAISLSFLLLAVLLSCYVSAIEANRMAQSLIEIDNNAKAVIALFSRAIAQTGNLGCARLSKEFPLRLLPDAPFSLQTRITGEDHALTVRYLTWLPVQVYPQPDLSRLVVDKTWHLHRGDIICIASCSYAEMTHIMQVKTHTLLLQPALAKTYAATAEVGIFNKDHFYIAKSLHPDKESTPVNALYRENIKHERMEYVSGVNQLLFTYTFKQNDKIWFDQPASAVQDWSQIIGITLRIDLETPPLKKTRYAYFVLP